MGRDERATRLGDGATRPGLESVGPADGSPSAGHALSGLFRTYGPWFLGLCCGNVWIGWMNGAHALQPIALWDALCALVMIATLAAGIWYGWRRGDAVRDAYALDWPIAALMAVGTLPAAGLLGGGAPWLLVISTIGTEIGTAWLYVRWGVFLGRLDIRATVGCIFAAHVVGCTAKLALYYVPTVVSALPVALLPLVSMATLYLACARGCRAAGVASGEEGTRPVAARSASGAPVIWCAAGRGSWGPLWKVAAFVACYRLIFQAGSAARGVTGSLSLSTVCCLAEIAVALIIIYMLLVRSGSFTFQQVWSIFLILMGIVLLCSLSPQVAALGTAVRAAAGSLLVMFTWLVFADILHHSALHSFVVFGVARIAYELPRLLVQGLALGGLEVPAGDAFFTGMLFFALLVFAVLFFDWRDPTLALIFSDFQRRDQAPAADAVLETCRQAARDYGLTQREEQVLLYLCQGRTRAYIAETLYLSENTVRGHVQRIYAKLDVHTKTELQRLLGV